MNLYDDQLARQAAQAEFLAGLHKQREDSLKSAAENQVAVAGLWVAMSLREHYLRNKLGPAGYERHSIAVTAVWGIAFLIGAIVFFLAGVTGWHGAVFSACWVDAAIIGLPGLYLIRAARVRHIRLIRGMYGN